MSDYPHEPWLVHLVAKLLVGDRAVLRLFDGDPFPDHPPRAIRASLYEYHFTHRGDPGGAWWTRRYVDEYLPAVTRDDPSLRDFLAAYGWKVE
jgi:hypothetical protein